MSVDEILMPNGNIRLAEHVEDTDFVEIGGNAQTSAYGGVIYGDYNRNLIGQNAIQTFDTMRRGDVSCRASMRVIKAPLLAGQWYFEPYSDSDLDKMVADFVLKAWNDMSRTGIQVLWEALLMLDFGYYAFEKVFKESSFKADKDRARAKDVVTWKKWGPRHPINTIGWDFDENGGVRKLEQYKSLTPVKTVKIPIESLLIFTLDEEAGNPEGISLLRTAYPHWYFKNNLYKVDAIQKERHGIGVPYVELPPNANPNDKKLAREMVRNLRTNEKAGMVIPAGWITGFMELHGNVVNPLESAQHHDLMIKANVLAEFLGLGTQASGARAVASTQEDVFTKSIHYLGDLICAVVNKFAIPELVLKNFGSLVDGFPKMRVRRLGDLTDLRAFSVALRNAIESGMITPDPQLEEWIRDYWDLPIPSSAAMARTVADRTEKSPNQVTGENTANRVDKPADGA